jgi:hypothetical protein
MIYRQFHCATIRDVEVRSSATTSPPMPDDTTAGPLVRMPLLRSENRSDRGKQARYRGAHEASNKGRAPPKRKERDGVAEAARDLVLELDESDACLAVVYNQATKATFLDGSSTKGRARPVRVIRTVQTQEPQPRRIAIVYCYLCKEQKEFLVEHIVFAAVITEHVAKSEACTGTWWHSEEPARRRTIQSSAAAATAHKPGQSLTLNPLAAQHLMSQATVCQFFMVVYAQQSEPTKSAKNKAVTTYRDGTTTDSERPRPIQLLGTGWRKDELISVECCLSNGRKHFSVQGLQWAQRVDRSVAKGEGCSGSWLPARTSMRKRRPTERAASAARAKRHKASNSNAGAGVATPAVAAAPAAGAAAHSAASQQVNTGAAAHSRPQSSAHQQPVAAPVKPRHVGVSWDKSEGKWRARVGHNGKTNFLGYFTIWEEAVDAVNTERKRLERLELSQQASDS